ncbi:probable LRR receptor-like serine/threonine-protein kinase At5g48740 [Amaranthus tricolor]|uniref:probable LRR receptor-like serine/threonine-protein kinase At5g48740 n=1 Tax=Amaranthus tricolor TaxID=29722 RepID=UPI00258C439C|nr:probable LRR receptor-like serine/threonine-protein kinase At5g48740 [Amaranthus tricolor]
MGPRFELWILIFSLHSLLNVILSQPEGFLSLSCGGTTYADSLNITWNPDDNYINVGETKTIINTSIRFFPDAKAWNCYKLPVQNTPSAVLIRTKFVYQNYDNLMRAPIFSVSLGRAMASTINLSKTDPWTEEFIWPVSNDYLRICFHHIPNGGNPVISSLELRPLPPRAYNNSGLEGDQKKFLKKCYRINCGYTNGSLRYPSDKFDRVWDSDKDFSPAHLSTALHTNLGLNTALMNEEPPMAVMQTARLLERRKLLTYNLALDQLGNYYIVLYFAGVVPVSSKFNISANGALIRSNYAVISRKASVCYFTMEKINGLNITLQNISFYPLINAIEVFQIGDIPQETSSTTVSALEVIQQFTGLDLGWEEDPCFPRPWNHITCDGNLVTSIELSGINLRSISPAFGDLLDLRALDLHNTSLTGEIQNLKGLLHIELLNLSFNELTSFGRDLDSLVNLQYLDLQNNSLHGKVPDQLGDLGKLHLLNLKNNKLQGPLPRSLKKKHLVVKTSGNLCLSFSTSACNRSGDVPIETPQFTVVPERKHRGHMHMIIVIGVVIGGICFIILIGLLAFVYTRKNTPMQNDISGEEAEIKNWSAARVFTYKEIKKATNNFKNVIGRGSFGSVYLGKLADGKMVAVKVRFDSSKLGADSFLNEVHLLSQIRHQNLVSLEGFCHELKQQILVYEYLAGGSLADSLYGSNSKNFTLNWVRRLKIAIDAVKGLHYLHNGSEPRIIHRDIKCSNILLDAQMNAKVSDFGLSKQVTEAEATNVTTIVKGTAGYLDPEYYSTLQLTEKSDIYSFGVVLLELICGREPFTRQSGAPDSFNLVLWAKPYLQAGMFDIVDDGLERDFDIESMRKAAAIASRCVERDATIRPTTAEVLQELKDSYSLQLAYLASKGQAN